MCLTPNIHNGNNHFEYGSDHSEKANLWETKVNDTNTRKVCADKNEFHPGKEWRPYAQ